MLKYDKPTMWYLLELQFLGAFGMFQWFRVLTNLKLNFLFFVF